ncbi:hypothetical protein B0H14DRAFT_2793625 [Mycena olivaceomarginata]|nr:hypothetical protein B0H14DRAFT_2793625 [Mycena olivaceomarginata]
MRGDRWSWCGELRIRIQRKELRPRRPRPLCASRLAAHSPIVSSQATRSHQCRPHASRRWKDSHAPAFSIPSFKWTLRFAFLCDLFTTPCPATHLASISLSCTRTSIPLRPLTLRLYYPSFVFRSTLPFLLDPDALFIPLPLHPSSSPALLLP